MAQPRPATEADAVHVALNLRPEDSRELQALGWDPRAATLDSWRMSPGTCWALGEPAAVIGGISSEGRPWLLCTPQVPQVSLSTLRASRALLRAARGLQGHRRLANATDIRNTVHHRWIELLGFTWGPPTTINGHQFRTFHME